MKNIFIVLILVSSISFSEEANFRGTSWGQSMETVKKIEKEELTQGSSQLYCLTKVAGEEALLSYEFFENKLYRAGYMMNIKHTNLNLYLDDYDKIVSLVKKNYGEPTKYDTVWNNSLYRDNPENYGMAIATGYVQIYSLWELPITKVLVLLTGDNYKISLAVVYASKALEKEIKNSDTSSKDF